MKQKFEIDRSRWHRGQGGEGSKLLRQDDKMCCVGLYLESCGVPRAKLLDVAYASGVVLPEQAKWLLDNSKNQCQYPGTELAVRNDSFNDDDEKSREEDIARLFAENDVEVTFK